MNPYVVGAVCLFIGVLIGVFLMCLMNVARDPFDIELDKADKP